MVLNTLFHLVDGHRPLSAVSALLVTPYADEVGVNTAMTFGMGDDQSGFATTTEHRALEIVGVDTTFLGTVIPGAKYCLYLYPRFLAKLAVHACLGTRYRGSERSLCNRDCEVAHSGWTTKVGLLGRLADGC